MNVKPRLKLIDVKGERQRFLKRGRNHRYYIRRRDGLRVSELSLDPYDVADLLFKHGQIEDLDNTTFDELQEKLVAWLTMLGQYA